MKLKKNSSEKKLQGAYYTPIQLADSMLNLINFTDVETVLEPSCGDGVFIESLKRNGNLGKIKRIDAVEIDAAASETVEQKFRELKNLQVFNVDFFEYYERSCHQRNYDLIIGNPPYIRYQYLTKKQRELQSEILEANGMKANQLINAWVAFLVACIQLLSEGGQIAFVIPAEILQVAYAEDLRLFLSEHLSKITLVTFRQLVFKEIQQETVVLIGEKGKEESRIRIIETENLDTLKDVDFNGIEFQKPLHVKDKWTQYFISSKESDLIRRIREDDRFVRFSDCGLINVGVTTGDNRFFSVNEEINSKYELDDVTIPLIGRSSHARGIFFTSEDWEYNKRVGKKARLVTFPDVDRMMLSEKNQEYISLGESMEIDKGYKCSIRNHWYVVPSVWIPDAFYLRRNNLYPKFVLNCCGAVSTDNVHRMKFYDGIVPENILLSYYNSISFAFAEICGRSYGGGVLEILPGEMGNIMLPKIVDIDSTQRDYLLLEIDSIIRNGDDIEKALDLVDQKVLVDILGIDPEWCCQCRKIWIKLRDRRMGR